MDEDSNDKPLLNRAAKSDDKADCQTSYGSFEDLTQDAYNRTAENGAGSQNGAADSYEMASLEEKKEKSTVEDIKKPSKSEPPRKTNGLFFLAKSSSISDTDGPSTSGTHLMKVPSKEGEISFGMDEVEGVKTESSKYLRLSTTVQEDDIRTHFMNMWDTPPELSITFLGGCDEYFVSEKIKKCLMHCISGLLRKVQCCLITRGSNIGITKIIGRVCSTETQKWNFGFKSHSIGILPWQYVCGRDALINTQSDEAVNYGSVAGNGTCRTENDDFQLDPNQDYFYFVDEGNDDNSRVEVDFVSKLNMILSNDLIPCIILLCGGGVSSLKAVYKVFCALEDGKKPMLVIMKGSGKLADLLSSIRACYQRNSKESLDSAIEHAVEPSSRDLANAIKENKDNKENTDYKSMLHFFMTEKIDQIFVFEMESKVEDKDDLQTVIFRAAKNASEGIDKPQFLFAVNLGDVNSVKKMSRESPYLAYNMMTKFITELESLIRVRELLEKCDFNVKSYVEERLLDLYKLVEPDSNKIRPRMAASEFDSNELIQFYRRTYLVEVEGRSFLDIDEVMREFSSGNTTLQIHTFGQKIKVNKKIINPIQALLINSVLLLDVNAAKLFWHFDQYNPLSNALLIFTLLKGIKSKTKSVSRASMGDFMEIQQYFESLMSSLLDAYFRTDKKMTEKVLTNKRPLWRNQSLIDVAGDIGLKSLIGKPGCQSVLAKRWKEVDDKSCCQTRCTRIFATPTSKLAIHAVLYVLSLVAFGVYLFYPNKSALEPIKWIVFVVMVSLTLDEVRQITDVGKSAHRNFKQWISSVWNILDILDIAAFFVGFGLSYCNKVASKYSFLLYLVLSCFKLLQFITAWQSFGAYMVMIGKMFLRMWKFLVVVLVSVFGYGIFMTAMLYPDANFNGKVLFHIFFRPYLILFGEPGIESFELSNTTTVFGTSRVSETSEAFVIGAMALFLLFANILLMNLLIADFSNIHEKILSQSDGHSRYQKYLLLKEFEKKPLLPIPLSIFENSYHLYRLCRASISDNTESSSRNAEEERRKIAAFEKYCFKKCFPKIPDTFDKVDHLV